MSLWAVHAGPRNRKRSPKRIGLGVLRATSRLVRQSNGIPGVRNNLPQLLVVNFRPVASTESLLCAMRGRYNENADMVPLFASSDSERKTFSVGENPCSR